MTVAITENLDAFSSLAEAVGLTVDGEINSRWFENPIGEPNSAAGLSTVMFDDGQRGALMAFLDDTLGPPDRRVDGEQIWVPLFSESGVVVSAVLETVAGAVRVGFGVEYDTGSAVPGVVVRAAVMAFQMPREGGGAGFDATGAEPDWLLLGRPGGQITIDLDITLSTDSPPAGEAFLGGAVLGVTIPTSAADGIGLSIGLRRLQLPGTDVARDFALDADSLADLDTEVLDFVVGLIQAQASTLAPGDQATEKFAALAGLLGLRAVPDLPAFPLAELSQRGVTAVVDWVEGVLLRETSRDAWLAQLASLLGGTADAVNDAVTFTIDDVEAAVGLRVAAAPGDGIVLTPWVSCSYGVRNGAKATAAVDLLEFTTTTGEVRALPSLSAQAVFGEQAGAAKLITGVSQIGTVRIGVELRDGQPAFAMTLHDVVAGGAEHPVLDLSSPDAAFEAAGSVVDAALLNALVGLGRPGELVALIVGLQPPPGITTIGSAQLLADPLGAVRTHWQELVATPAALDEVVRGIAELVLGSTTAPPGTGTEADPWTIALGSSDTGAGLALWTEGPLVAVDVRAGVETAVFGGEFSVVVDTQIGLARIDLAAPQVQFLPSAAAQIALGRADGDPTRIPIGPTTLLADRLGVTLRWSTRSGLRVGAAAPGLALEIPEVLVEPLALPVPTISDAGDLVFDPTPDWGTVEVLLASLLERTGSPILDALLQLVGWSGAGARLDLGLLLDDPEAAIHDWLGDVVLDCDNIQRAFAPVAHLLSGFRTSDLHGVGNPRSPFRSPIGASDGAPGLAVWTDTGCRPPELTYQPRLGDVDLAEPPEADTLVAALHDAASSLPDLADLLVGRAGLASGFTALRNRCVGTDGVLGRPASLPAEVAGVDLGGYGYRELVALGVEGTLLTMAIETVPTAVLYLGCEQRWADAFGPANSFDGRVNDPSALIPTTGDGRWSLAIPLPREAEIDRPDLGAVGAQAARIAAVLALRSDPITVVAYGSAGAAAIRAAMTAPEVSRVVTVGAPWAPVAMTAFETGSSGDAVRFLRQLGRPERAEWPEDLLAFEMTPARRAHHLLDRLHTLVLADLPVAADEARRADLRVDAVFGQLNEDELDLMIGGVVQSGIDHRFDVATQAVAPSPTSLHVGVSVPVVDLDLGGVLVGAGVIAQLMSADRGATGDGFMLHNRQRLLFDVQLGVTDGWLVGGPGAAQSDIEVRWVSARVTVPLGDDPTDDASLELVLHEATCFGVFRERWTVALDADELVAGAASEVHLIIGEVVDRLVGGAEALTADVSQFLERVGVVRAGGYDPHGLDRLLHDTGATVSAAQRADPASLATVMRRLSGATGTDAVVEWTAGDVSVAFDMAAASLVVTTDLAIPGAGNLTAEVTIQSAGVRLEASLGELDPTRGGIELAAVVDTAAATEDKLMLRWQSPGQTSTTSVRLLPSVDPHRLIPLLAATAAATVTRTLIDSTRARLDAPDRARFDAVIEPLGLLHPGNNHVVAGARLAVGAFLDPGAWLRHAAPGWTVDPLGQAVTTLDALVPLVAPGRTGSGWPLTDEVTITFRTAGGRLELGVAVDSTATFGPTQVAATLGAGVSIAADGGVAPSFDTDITIDGRGLSLRVAPTLRLDLVRGGSLAPLPIYPTGPGLGALAGGAANMVLPAALNALIEERTNTSASLRRSVAQTVFDIGSAMGLVELDDSGDGHFAEALIATFADDPVAALSAHLTDLVGLGLQSLTDALNSPSGPARITAGPDGPGRLAISFGAGATAAATVVLDGSSDGPAVELRSSFVIDEVGTLVVEKVRLSASGVEMGARFESVGVGIGARIRLYPTLTVRAGVGTASADRVLGVGLATDDTYDSAVEFRWNLDSTAARVVAVDRGDGGEIEITAIDQVSLTLLGILSSLAVQLVIDGLGSTVGPKTIAALRGVVFTDSGSGTSLDPQLFVDLSDPEKLLDRLWRLGFNLADADISLTVDTHLNVGFALDDTGTRAGIFVTLAAGRSIALSDGDTIVSLEVDSSWVSTTVEPGFTLYLIQRSGTTFSLSPSAAVAGLGVRVAKTSGALLDLGAASIDAIAVHVYGEVADSGVGAGIHLKLDGLAIAPSGGGDQEDGRQNAVANNLMSDAADGAGPAARPSFSPSFAVQAPPGGEVGVTLRAGDPPGPWWIVVQRQLGPLYLEQFGFNAVEANGSIIGISLLFDAKVSLFGLSAEVDQLGLHWLGGDIFDVGNWRVDLEGLAISADFAGVAISGGLFKTDFDGSIGYVGMLMGRFGVYGLSLFGGYTDQNGVPSFFVFGAVNGPIGGPPAFFITGLGGGLGINRALRVPDDVAKMSEYPFIKALDVAATPSTNPMQELKDLADYFPPENGTFWFAAGLSFNSFALVDAVAVASVSFGNGLEINLFGLARMALPRPEAALVSIELGLLARFSTEEGLFLIQAQLTENSWLLYPEVRITGGFAFAMWWKGALAGQFVLTIGGYHPSFNRDGYPVVPRLGLEWRVTDDIVIKGSSYFALTSEALMAGVAVEVSADFGFVWAKVVFGADGIVYFDPFYFIVVAYAKISAGLKIKTWFGTIRISISIGASIRVEGPRFHGVATLEIGPCDISVPFGNRSPVEGTVLDWRPFVDKYLEAASPGVARAITGITGKGTLPASTGGSMSAPSSDGSAARPYEVFAEFELSLVTSIPTSRFRFGPEGDTDTTERATPIRLSNNAATRLGIRPMDAGNLESILTIRLRRKQSGTWVDHTDRLQQLVVGLAQYTEGHTGASWTIQGFPLGVWGEPVGTDPTEATVPKGDVLFAANSITMVAEANLLGLTGPEIDYRKIESGRRTLPLAASGTNRASMLDAAGEIDLTTVTSAFEAMANAKAQLFADRGTATTVRLVGRADRSKLAAASFSGARSAPPLFGTLTDGLEPANSSGPEIGFIARPTAPVAPMPRSPHVSGYLTSGAGVVERPVGTSVGDNRIKRRAAPTTASVRGRLGRELPLQLHAVAPPALAADATLVLQGEVPRTDVGSSTRSYAGATVGSTLGGTLVAGLLSTNAGSTRSPRVIEPGRRIRSGDVVVLRCPDSHLDLADSRPALIVEGRARVVMLAGNGQVLVDNTVVDGRIDVAPSSALIAVQADGDIEGLVPGSGGEGVFGWHGTSRLAGLGARSALVPGCVLTTEGTGARGSSGWATGADAVRGAEAVTTTFDRPVEAIAVVLRSNTSDRLGETAVEIFGAERVRRSDGSYLPPTVVQAGERSILVFDVVAAASPATGDATPTVVRVVAGSGRQVNGIIASMRSAESLAQILAERGPATVVSRLRAGAGPGCALTFEPAEERS